MLSPEAEARFTEQQAQLLSNIAAQLKQNEIPTQLKIADVPQTEHDPFTFTEEEAREFSNKPVGLIPSVKAAIDKSFHVFALTPKDKHPLPGSQGFKDSRSP